MAWCDSMTLDEKIRFVVNRTNAASLDAKALVERLTDLEARAHDANVVASALQMQIESERVKGKQDYDAGFAAGKAEAKKEGIAKMHELLHAGLARMRGVPDARTEEEEMEALTLPKPMLTPWYPSDIKPVRDGWYVVNALMYHHPFLHMVQYKDNLWVYPDGNPHHTQCWSWRGLTSQQEE